MITTVMLSALMISQNAFAARLCYFDKQDDVKYSVSEYSLGLDMRFNPFYRVDIYGVLSYNPKTYSSDLMIEDNEVNEVSVAFGTP